MLEAGADAVECGLEIFEHLRRLGAKIPRFGHLAGHVVAELTGDVDDAAGTGDLDHMGIAAWLGDGRRVEKTHGRCAGGRGLRGG